MHFDFGTIVAIIAALLFYLRLIMLQRHRGKHTSAQSRFVIKSWLLVGVGALFILLGGVLSATPYFQDSIQSFWWIPLVIGILLMSLGIS